MNERISKLAEQAGFDLRDGQSYKVENFAELIIQENIKVVQSRFMGDLNREDMEVKRCVEALQNHWK